jgi:hypothetical protein
LPLRLGPFVVMAGLVLAIHETAKQDAQLTEKLQQPGINRGPGIAA